MSLSADIDSSVDLLGKSVTELQSEVSVSGDTISGTLLYVDDYTGFSGDPAEQAGNYLVVKCTADEGDTIVLDLIGGTHGPVTLDEDGICIIRVTNKDTQKLKYTATGADGSTEEHIWNLTGLTLTPAT
jgi:hypothetical protein